MIAWLAAAALGAPTVHVRDLEPTVVPARIEFRNERLWVDGVKVRGSRHAQLDYLASLFAEPDGSPPAELRLEERHRALRRSNAAAVVGIGLVAAGTVASIAFPPAMLPLAAGKAVVSIGSAGVGLQARKAWDQEELSALVDRGHLFASTELP